jgi:hypothetical protein
MAEAPTTARAPEQQTDPIGPRSASGEAGRPADGPSGGEEDIASQIDALLANVETAQEEINAVLDEGEAASPGEHTDDANHADLTAHADPLSQHDQNDHNDHNDPADPLADLTTPTASISNSAPATDSQSFAAQIDDLVANLGASPPDQSAGAAGAAPAASAAGSTPDAPAPAASAPNSPAQPEQDIASQVSSLLASLPEVLAPAEPDTGLSPPPDTDAGTQGLMSDDAAPVASGTTASEASIDEQIATLTNNLIQSESPSADRLAEILKPEINPVVAPAPPGPKALDEEPAHPAGSATGSTAQEAESLLPPAAPKPKAGAVLVTKLAAGGKVAGAAINSGLAVVAAPLESRPALAKGLGWVSLNTIFLAGCLWAFLIFVRLPAVESAKATSFDFSHGSLPAPPKPHDPHASTDAHGKDGAGDGHGADAGGHGAKDAGDAKKSGSKKPAAKKEPAKKESAKKDPKKDAKKPAGGH